MQSNHRLSLKVAASLSIAAMLALAGHAVGQQQNQPTQPATGQPVTSPAAPAQPVTPTGTEPQAAAPAAAGGMLSLDSNTVDLGVISDEKPVERMIVFKNTGPG